MYFCRAAWQSRAPVASRLLGGLAVRSRFPACPTPKKYKKTARVGLTRFEHETSRAEPKSAPPGFMYHALWTLVPIVLSRLFDRGRHAPANTHRKRILGFYEYCTLDYKPLPNSAEAKMRLTPTVT